MPLYIGQPPEPLSPSAIESSQPSRRVHSQQSQQLHDTMLRYLRGEVSGRSILIGGSRGSGKTTLVKGTIHDLDLVAQSSRNIRRPVYVPLHGPSLLPESDEIEVEFFRRFRESVKSTKAEEKWYEQYWPNRLEDEATSQAFKLEFALEQIAKVLYVAVADVITRSFRRRIIERDGQGHRQEALDGLEMAAQLQLELDREPEVARLRMLWDHINRLDSGVLFPDMKTGPEQVDRGLTEIVALASAIQVNLRINNNVSHETKESEDKAQVDARTSEFGGKVNEIMKPLLPILTGGATTTATFSSLGPFMAVLSGIAVSLAAGMTVQLTSERKRSRSQKEEFVLLRDLSSRSLLRLMPSLIDRLCSAGLAPIFVIDELDKIKGLKKEMNDLVGFLKQFCGEDAFFCFLTGREFFEEMEAEMRKGYRPIYTYFTDLLYVVHDPNEIRDYFLHEMTEGDLHG